MIKKKKTKEKTAYRQPMSTVELSKSNVFFFSVYTVLSTLLLSKAYYPNSLLGSGFAPIQACFNMFYLHYNVLYKLYVFACTLL